MNRPPLGLTLAARFISARDGDTQVYSLLDGRFRPAIRLIGVDCPEAHTDAGRAATRFVVNLLENTLDITVHIPTPRNVANLLANLSFDRLPGYVFLGPHRTLQDALLNTGHAIRTKTRP